LAGKTTFGGGTSDAFVALINGASFPNASISPATLNFGNQNVGTAAAPQTATLKNTGNGILTISSISIVGTGGDYTQTNNCGSQLTPAGGAKDNCTITVTFSPTAAGSRPDIIRIVDNSDNSPQSLALSGTGVAVQGTIQFSSSALAFGDQTIGTTCTAKTVTLTNGSSANTLTISTITIANGFKQTNNCPVSPATLAANASCTIQVTFAPTVAGSVASSLTVRRSGKLTTIHRADGQRHEHWYGRDPDCSGCCRLYSDHFPAVHQCRLGRRNSYLPSYCCSAKWFQAGDSPHVLRSFGSNLHGISGFVSHGRHIESIGDRDSDPRGEHQQTQSFNWGAEARTATDLRFGLPTQPIGPGRGWKKAAGKVSAAAGGVWGSSLLRQLRCKYERQRGPGDLSGDGDRCVQRRQPLDSSHPNGNLTSLGKALPATFGWPELS